MVDLPPTSPPSSANVEDVAPSQQAPPCGQMIAGVGCYVNPHYITKIEVSSGGSAHFVRAFSANPAIGPSGQGGSASVLAGPFDYEGDAFEACDALVQAWFLTYSTNPRGATWPDPGQDPRRPATLGGASVDPFTS